MANSVSRSAFCTIYVHEDGRYEVLVRDSVLKQILKDNVKLGQFAPFKRFLRKSGQIRPLASCEFCSAADIGEVVSLMANILATKDKVLLTLKNLSTQKPALGALTTEEIALLKQTGMFWEFYPEAKGTEPTSNKSIHEDLGGHVIVEKHRECVCPGPNRMHGGDPSWAYCEQCRP